MARGRKGGAPSRMDLRRQNDAVEAREDEEKEEEEEEEGDEEEEDDEEEADDVEAEAEEEPADDDDDAGDDDDDEDGPKKKKKKKKVKVVAPKKEKKRKSAKEVRTKAMWVVLDNSSKRVGIFEYAERKDADELLKKKLEEKPGFYIQMIKEPLEVK